MTSIARWRAGAGVAFAAGVALSLGVARQVRGGYARALAGREAVAAAAYLAVVTPVTRNGVSYDLPQLLIRARALEALPVLSGRFEVYQPTAPLVHATAPPLPTEILQRLRRDASVYWAGDAAVSPLFDRTGWDVVGAVAARPDTAGGLGSPWLLAAMLLVVAAAIRAAQALGGRRADRRAVLGAYAIAVALFSAAVYGDLREAAGTATDRWLDEVRILMQEAAVRVPDVRSAPDTLVSLARGGEIVPGDSSGAGARRLHTGGVSRAAVSVRLASGRWVELRVPADEAGTIAWLPVIVGFAALGPLVAVFAAWSLAAPPRRRRETVAAWGFLAPSVLHLAVFSLVPLVLLLYVSVHRWTPVESAAPFVGLGNYARVLEDPVTWSALGHTALYALYVPISLTLALGLAVAFARSPRLGAFVNGVLLLPYTCSVVALALVWRWMYSADDGVLNRLLIRGGLAPVNWLEDPKTALAAVMIVSLWMQVGYQFAVLSAGLRAIPAVYLDAARVDGAGAWQRFWRVTFPLLRPVTRLLLLTGVIGAFQVFGLVVVLTGGGPGHATDVIVSRIYHVGWDLLQFGEASALAVLLCMLLLGAAWGQLTVLERRVEYG